MVEKADDKPAATVDAAELAAAVARAREAEKKATKAASDLAAAQRARRVAEQSAEDAASKARRLEKECEQMNTRVTETLPLRDVLTVSRMAGSEQQATERMARHLGVKSSTFAGSGGGGRGGGGAKAAAKPAASGGGGMNSKNDTKVKSLLRDDTGKGARAADLESLKGFKKAFKVRIGNGKNAEERWVIDMNEDLI